MLLDALGDALDETDDMFGGDLLERVQNTEARIQKLSNFSRQPVTVFYNG